MLAFYGLVRLDIQEGKADAARKRLLAFVAKHGENPDLLLALAALEGDAQDRSESIALAERARAGDPGALAPRLVLAAAYLNKGAVTDALRIAEEAVRLAPEHAGAALLLARAQLARNDAAAALKIAAGLVSREPNSAAGHLLVGLAKRQLNDPAGARTALERALDLGASDLMVLPVLAQIAMQQHRADAAVAFARRLQSRYPQLSLGFALEGDALVVQGNVKQAAERYDAAAQRSQSADIVVRQAGARWGLGDGAEARRILESWLGAHPADHPVRVALAELDLAEAKVDLAIAEYERVLQAEPDNWRVGNNLALLYLGRDDSKADALSNRIVQLVPNEAPAVDTRGWILTKTGRLSQGVATLQQAVRLAPDNPSIRFRLAQALLLSGDRAAGAAEIKTALQTSEAFPERKSATELMKTLSN